MPNPHAPEEPRRVLLVGSSGGHLAQLYRLRSWWETRERLWVTFDTKDATTLLAGERIEFAYHPTTRSLKALLVNSWRALRLVPREKPDLIVTTGAAVAFPYFVLGWLLGIATVYIEVFDRIDSPTLTVRLCKPFTDRVLVQWDEQLDFLPDAEVVGRLL